MKSLSIILGLALLAPIAVAETAVQQGTLIGETEAVAANGEVVKAKIFRFKAAAVGTCVFGRETVIISRDGQYTDDVVANGECAYDDELPICNLKTIITVTDRDEERIKRWNWERNIDWSDDKGGEPVKIKKKSKLLKKNYLDVTFAFRKMACSRLEDSK